MRLFVLSLTALAGIATPGWGSPKPASFVFSKTDLRFLDECAALDRHFDADGLVYRDSAFETRLSVLAGPLLPPAPPERVQWRFRVLRDPAAGAFALPNGSVYIRMGLLARLENDDELAGVLAHQIAHVSARHGYLERRALRETAAALNAATFVGFGAIGVLATSGVMSPASALIFNDGYKSDFEHAADVAAMDALHSMGRDQGQYLRLLGIFASPLDPFGESPVSHSYAGPEERVTRLRAKFPSIVAAASAADDGYIDRVAAVVAHDITLAIDGRRFHSAVAAAERLAAAHSRDVEALFLAGQAYYALGPRPSLAGKDASNLKAQRAAKHEMQEETAEDEARRLAATTEGRANLLANYAKAEEWFRKAVALAPQSPQPHLGLGMLYQEQGKPDAAIAEYRQYLQFAADGLDRARVERRLAALAAEGGKK